MAPFSTPINLLAWGHRVAVVAQTALTPGRNDEGPALMVSGLTICSRLKETPNGDFSVTVDSSASGPLRLCRKREASWRIRDDAARPQTVESLDLTGHRPGQMSQRILERVFVLAFR